MISKRLLKGIFRCMEGVPEKKSRMVFFFTYAHYYMLPYQTRFSCHFCTVWGWYVSNNFVPEWFECAQILCDDTADKNCSILKKFGLHMLVREKFCKMNFSHWFLALLVLQSRGLNSVQYRILMCPVYRAICVCLGLNSHRNFMVDIVTNKP